MDYKLSVTLKITHSYLSIMHKTGLNWNIISYQKAIIVTILAHYDNGSTDARNSP